MLVVTSDFINGKEVLETIGFVQTTILVSKPGNESFDELISNISKKSSSMGANAVVSLKITYQETEMHNDTNFSIMRKMYITAYGTAVKIR